jgi:CheY-like chemotaxis protein
MQAIVKPEQKIDRPLRVLMVEDAQSDITLLLLALREGGFEVTYKAVITQAAMRVALQHHKWDLITSDHGMPQFSSQAALALTLEVSPDVPFIIVSGEIDINIAVALMHAGARDYVQKTELVRLVPVIQRLLHDREVHNDKVLADQALVASEAQYRRLFESAQDGILIVEAETGQIRDVNPSCWTFWAFHERSIWGRRSGRSRRFRMVRRQNPPSWNYSKEATSDTTTFRFTPKPETVLKSSLSATFMTSVTRK